MKTWKVDSLLNRAGTRVVLTILLLSFGSIAIAADLASERAGRTAIERVYYNHRLGEKPLFEQVLSPATLEKLVRQDFAKEAALKKVYGVVITPAMLDGEVQRINTTTRAPEMLAEIKAALDDDPVRFANVFSKPILVERLLREKFDNDDALHAPQRRQFENTRDGLLAARTKGANCETLGVLLKRSYSNAVTETTWQLPTRPVETNASSANEIEIKKRFGPDAQIVSPALPDGKEAKFYFEDLPGELQNVLRMQLRQSGDISAVIEMPSGFLLCVAKARTDVWLKVTLLSQPKRSYDEWLHDQTIENP